MYNSRHNQPSSLNVNYFVPGLPMYDGIAESLAFRVIDFVGRVFEFIARLGR